jgi:polyhydroxyalkanoate synthase subunit PhaC
LGWTIACARHKPPSLISINVGILPRKVNAVMTLPHKYSDPLKWERDDWPLLAPAEMIDRVFHAGVARVWAGRSPGALAVAYFDWLTHLILSPGKQLFLSQKAYDKAFKLARYAMQCASQTNRPPCCIQPLPQDKRFAAQDWQAWPFNIMHQSFLLTQQWWHNATTDVRGVESHHEKMVEFGTRQWLDFFAPSNFLATNPELLSWTFQEGGENLRHGYENFLEDWQHLWEQKPAKGSSAFKVGSTVAVTPGKIVFRNHLFELIQYAPAPGMVRPEPILIVPAWIMKYYILDLSPHNSLVRYLVEQGFTVFVMSWKNPGPEDRELSLEDYRGDGVMKALDTVGKAVSKSKVHAVGYCLGGTLLSIAAAAMARDGDDRIKSLTFLAAQVDFTEAGELTLFIDNSQVAMLEDMMFEQGYLDAQQMAGAFRMLRSNDLIWSRMVREYLMGEREDIDDLAAWNADATRLPYRMHSDYLRKLFLHNELAIGLYHAGGRSVALSDIRAPVFALATEWDHVAPWRSVYKYNVLTDTDVTFLLTDGGHNRGIVASPENPDRHYHLATRRNNELYVDPDKWVESVPPVTGSWWPAWSSWLLERSGPLVKPPPMAKPLADAPGEYVHMH